MDLASFTASLTQPKPPADLSLALQALWQDRHGDWAAAHKLCQSREGEPTCDWVHAYLHRKEGDLANAGYWYRRAGKPMTDESLEAEWQAIAQALLAK
ncbi:MAG: hypothetical protein KJZ93_11095 [Caldilineaceae bacterium]|nr:hypothetical protein [Caldilineaceae bacterium]